MPAGAQSHPRACDQVWLSSPCRMSSVRCSGTGSTCTRPPRSAATSATRSCARPSQPMSLRDPLVALRQMREHARPDFTTESTEFTETDRKERRVRTRNPEPFPSGLCGLCALCGEPPDRTSGPQIPRKPWLAPMASAPRLAARPRPAWLGSLAAARRSAQRNSWGRDNLPPTRPPPEAARGQRHCGLQLAHTGDAREVKPESHRSGHKARSFRLTLVFSSQIT